MTLREWYEHFRNVPFDVFAFDAFVLWFEVPYMKRILGCTYRLRLEKNDPRTGWYKDGKFLTEEL